MVPSLAIGVGAFCAGELVFHVAKKENIVKKSMNEIIMEAKTKNLQIAKIIPKIEDPELVKMIKEINLTVEKIIKTVETKPDKYKKSEKFFNYYLPVTIKILNRYDEIENQKLTSEESQKFMESTKKMIEKTNNAFKKQLSSLYQSDMRILRLNWSFHYCLILHLSFHCHWIRRFLEDRLWCFPQRHFLLTFPAGRSLYF